MQRVFTLEWTLGDRLAKARRHAGLTSSEMGDELGVTRYTVHNYETDRTTPRRATLIAWALRCGVPFEWLAHGDTAPAPDGASEQGSAPTPRFAVVPQLRAAA